MLCGEDAHHEKSSGRDIERRAGRIRVAVGAEGIWLTEAEEQHLRLALGPYAAGQAVPVPYR